MTKVFISPNYTGQPEHVDNGGIRRVVSAMVEHLPKFGIEVVTDIARADVINNHGGALMEHGNTPLVNTSHGLYWSRQPWGDGFHEVNAQLVESMRRSVAHTAPSQWVSTAIRRGGFFYPEVVYHGVDADKFKPETSYDDYVLWNKARADYVSDPGDMIGVAEISPKINFVSTLGSQNKAYVQPNNLKVIGVVPYEKMKKVVSRAGVYLATARETFGIGTLEAMAYGVPVAGWDWGGQSEIIKQGITGYLAPPGDYKELKRCIEMCFMERDRLSANAIDDVRANWKWEPRIEQYANIFKRVDEKYSGYSSANKVSVVVTAYRLDEYLPTCLDSIQRQTWSDFECIVIDDALLDSTERIVKSYARKDGRFRYVRPPQNLGLPGARNFGLQVARGEYIRHVDADDYLASNCLQLEITALDQDRGIDIAYGHLEVVNTDGTRTMENGEPVRTDWPPLDFNWYHQMAHLNQLPSCVMARREVYEKSGGYRTRMKRNEDAEFWCRVTSLGFRAKKFTQAVTYFHRERSDSKGATEWQKEGAEPDWTAWFPWRMGASDYRQARDVLRKRGNAPKNSHMVPFGAQGTPPKELKFFYVHDYAYPVVSIVVTCGPGHKPYLIDALDSIQAQTFPDWECIVVNDTGEPWPADIMGAPFARVVNMDGNQGASAARNEGLKHVKGKYIVWMDADDYWTPWFLEKMVLTAESNYGVIYSDLIMETSEGMKINRYKEFDSTRIIHTMGYPGSSVLIPIDIAYAVVKLQGGFDTEIPGLEDWDHQVAIHHLGYCAYHVPEPLFIYRMETSTKREKDYAKIDKIVEYIDRKWSVYRKGDKQIMCGCAPKKIPPSALPQSLLTSSGNFTQESIQLAVDANPTSMMVMLEYIGETENTFSIRSRVSRDITYRFGNNDYHRSRAVYLGDAQYLLGITDAKGNPTYRVVSSVAAVESIDPASFVGQPIMA